MQCLGYKNNYLDVSKNVGNPLLVLLYHLPVGLLTYSPTDDTPANTRHSEVFNGFENPVNVA